MKNVNSLRKNCKKLMIDLGLDKPGYINRLGKELKVNPNSLSMALTGYRKGPGYQKILETLHAFLQTTSSGETSRYPEQAAMHDKVTIFYHKMMLAESKRNFSLFSALNFLNVPSFFIVTFLLNLNGVSQSAIARELHVSRAYVHQVLAGKRDSRPVKQAVSKALGVDPWAS